MKPALRSSRGQSAAHTEAKAVGGGFAAVKGVVNTLCKLGRVRLSGAEKAHSADRLPLGGVLPPGTAGRKDAGPGTDSMEGTLGVREVGREIEVLVNVPAPSGLECLLGLCTLDLDVLGHNLMRIQLDDSIDGKLRDKGDKAKAPRVTGLVIIHDLRLCDITKPSKVSMQFALATGGRKATNEDLFGSAGSGGRVKTRRGVTFGARDGDLGFDLTAIELMKFGGDTLGDELVVVGDKAEAAGMTGETVAHDDAVGDGTVLGKVVA